MRPKNGVALPTSINQASHDPSSGRPTCYSCMRPSTHCICALVEPVEAHCNFLILQHPHERKKYYSTAKLVTKALKTARLLRGLHFEPNLLESVAPGQKHYLLFPGDDAVSCESIPLTLNDTVVVVDGTWAEARKILIRNPTLKSLATLTFTQPLISRYRIRKQPRAGYLSTIESIGHLLQINALARGDAPLAASYDALFLSFERMIAQQLRHLPVYTQARSC